MRGLPFYVKREAFARADTRQRVAYILSAVLVITMLCVIFRFSAADATHSSHLSEGICIRLVRELNSVFPEQFPKEKLVKVAEAIEYPIRKCAHFTEYAVLGITVNLYLWMCYRMEMLLSRKKKAKDTKETPALTGLAKDSAEMAKKLADATLYSGMFDCRMDKEGSLFFVLPDSIFNNEYLLSSRVNGIT